MKTMAPQICSLILCPKARIQLKEHLSFVLEGFVLWVVHQEIDATRWILLLEVPKSPVNHDSGTGHALRGLQDEVQQLKEEKVGK